MTVGPWDFELQNNSDGLIIRIIDDSSDNAEYAIYVYRNDVKIHTFWYTGEKNYRYDHHDLKGIYYCVAFKKIPGSPPELKSSKTVMVFGADISLATIAENFIDGPNLIKVDNVCIPVLFRRQPGDRLFVLLSGAINRHKTAPPVFNRWSWAKKFPGSVICIADPTLELDGELELGWYVGLHNQDFTKSCTELIGRVAETLSINKNNIITYGSSGGGFAALMMTAKLGAGTAVAINCQSEILNYNKVAVERFVNVCFKSISPDQISEIYRNRVSASSAWKSIGAPVHAVVVQNKTDQHHYHNHYLTLIDSLSIPEAGGASVDGRHFAFVYESDSGHGPEPLELFPSILAKALEYTTRDYSKPG